MHSLEQTRNNLKKAKMLLDKYGDSEMDAGGTEQ